MNRETALSVLRHALTFGGGIAVARGWLDSASLQAAIGAIVTLAGIAWGIADKQGREG